MSIFMKPRLITCMDCGIERLTCSRGIRCCKCQAKMRYTESRNKIIKQLEDLGHVDVKEAGYTSWGSFSYTFTHNVCGTTQTWSLANIKNRLNAAPDVAPCSKCGAKTRMAAAMKGYIAKYGLDESMIDEWNTYRKVTRRLTAKTYRLHEAEINPKGYVRGMDTYHLDHIVPIIYGFKNNISPEEMARKENLQLLPAKENLSKARKTYGETKPSKKKHNPS